MDKFDIALSAIDGLKPSIVKLLIEKFASAEQILSADEETLAAHSELNDFGIRIISRAMRNPSLIALATSELNYCNLHNIIPIAATDPTYPTLLRDIVDPPHVIYAMGDTSILNKTLISIVGSRNASNYGQRVCYKIIEELALRVDDIAIVSGLAHGIDSVAHRAAVDLGVPTIAVLPCALPNVTPPQNRMLANTILDQGGLLLSELRSTQPTTRHTFLPRNRIIAALAELTLIVESDIKGGSFATALAAARYDRRVAAVPGRIDDDTSQGCNELIRRGIAEMVTSAEEIITIAQWQSHTHTTK